MKVGDVVKITLGSVRITSGPIPRIVNTENRKYWIGEKILDEHDPYGEPYSVHFAIDEIIP